MELQIIAIFLTVIGIVSGIAVKFYFASKKDIIKKSTDSATISSEVKHVTEDIKEIKDEFDKIWDVLDSNNINYDSVNKQIADIRERIARLEGPK